NASERREKLFEYFGTKTDIEIIKEHKKLLPLLEMLDGLTINEARQKVLQEQKRVNERLKSIQIKIEGIQAAKPEKEELEPTTLNVDRLKLTKKKADLSDELTNIRNGGSVGETLSKVRVKQAELQEAKITHENVQNAKLNGIEQGK